MGRWDAGRWDVPRCPSPAALSNIFATYTLPVKQVFSLLLILAIATIKGRKNSLVWQYIFSN